MDTESKWIAIGTALTGFATALFILIKHFYEAKKARTEAALIQVPATKVDLTLVVGETQRLQTISKKLLTNIVSLNDTVGMVRMDSDPTGVLFVALAPGMASIELTDIGVPHEKRTRS